MIDQMLFPGHYYHIYNRGINGENIFQEPRNYTYFLKLYEKYVTPIAETYAYCLLKNHFHILIKIKDESDLTGFQNLSGLNPKLHLPFSHFFNAYSKAFNKAYQRTGSLFERPFKRILISDQSQLINIVIYIHQNPQKHGFQDDFKKWPYSSFSLIFKGNEPLLETQEVLTWFDGEENLRSAHKTQIDLSDFDK